MSTEYARAKSATIISKVHADAAREDYAQSLRDAADVRVQPTIIGEMLHGIEEIASDVYRLQCRINSIADRNFGTQPEGHVESKAAPQPEGDVYFLLERIKQLRASVEGTHAALNRLSPLAG